MLWSGYLYICNTLAGFMQTNFLGEWYFTLKILIVISTWRCRFSSVEISIIKMGRSTDRLILKWKYLYLKRPLHWRHNDVSNHQPHGCLLNRLSRRRSKKTSKLLVTGLCAGNSPGPVNSPHKRPVTRKMFPFDDVIMTASLLKVTKG